MATDNRLVTLTPDPSANRAGGNSGSYYSITAGLVDNATYGPISSGGWQVVDRPFGSAERLVEHCVADALERTRCMPRLDCKRSLARR